jgi:hypothetical protein
MAVNVSSFTCVGLTINMVTEELLFSTGSGWAALTEAVFVT